MQSFNEIQIYDFENGRHADIIKEIQSKGKDYLLKVDEQEFINYLYDKYVLEPLTIHQDTESFDKPHTSKERLTDYQYERGYYETEAYTFTIKYNYSGSDELFYVHTNPWNITSYEISLDKRLKKVSFSFKIYKQDAEEFRQKKSECYGNAFSNLENVNKNAADFNRTLRDTITRSFQKEKEKYLKENDFFAAINIKINLSSARGMAKPTPGFNPRCISFRVIAAYATDLAGKIV